MENNSKSVMKCQRKKKLDAVEKFGGKCQICGYNKCINALEFHHLEDKKESPSFIIMRWSWKRACEELKKCILLCANCHREIHYKDVDINFDKIISDWHQLICENCGKIFETKRQSAKYCCVNCSQIAFRKTKRPSKEELEILVKEFPMTYLGKKFSVSDNAVRKWCKSYGITFGK